MGERKLDLALRRPFTEAWGQCQSSALWRPDAGEQAPAPFGFSWLAHLSLPPAALGSPQCSDVGGGEGLQSLGLPFRFAAHLCDPGCVTPPL